MKASEHVEVNRHGGIGSDESSSGLASAERTAGRPRAQLACAERRQEFPTRSLVENRQIDGTVALIAQDLDQRRPSLFRRGLKLAIGDTQQMHLQRLYEKILCVSAVRTR